MRNKQGLSRQKEPQIPMPQANCRAVADETYNSSALLKEGMVRIEL
jgi:hypothetical protein